MKEEIHPAFIFKIENEPDEIFDPTNTDTIVYYDDQYIIYDKNDNGTLNLTDDIFNIACISIMKNDCTGLDLYELDQVEAIFEEMHRKLDYWQDQYLQKRDIIAVDNQA